MKKENRENILMMLDWFFSSEKSFAFDFSKAPASGFEREEFLKSSLLEVEKYVSFLKRKERDLRRRERELELEGGYIGDGVSTIGRQKSTSIIKK